MDNLISLLISMVALIISFIALIYTVRTFLLKAGADVRGSFSTCSSRDCQDRYIGSVTLENLKDKSLAIFSIYLKIGHNYFLMIESFNEKPLILKPFEVFHKEYDPIDLYSVNMKRIDLNRLFSDSGIKKQIILSTPDGRYNVDSWIKRWEPTYDFFRNHLTIVVHPRRSIFKGKSYGSNAKYIVDIKAENDREETIAVYPRDYEIKRFRKFQLTKESLVSKESLEEFLYEKVSEGLLNCEDISVHDVQSWLNEVYQSENQQTIKAKYYNWAMYNLFGPVYTKFSDYRLWRKNRLLRNRANKKIQPTQKTRG